MTMNGSPAPAQTPPVAVVTGVSSGLGAAIAMRLTRDGHTVIGTSRTAAFPATVAIGRLNLVPLDVTSVASVAAFVAWLDACGQVPDAVVLNAGFGISGAVEETSDALAEQQMQVNFLGVHRLIVALLPRLRQRRQGRIVFIGSVGGRIALPFQALYSASKAAVAIYAAALRQEVMVHGIHVSLIEPGDHRTGFGKARRKAAAGQASAYEPQASRALRMMEASEERGGDPADLAELVRTVLSQRRPRFRYVEASPKERVFIALAAILPYRLFERIVMNAFRVPQS